MNSPTFTRGARLVCALTLLPSLLLAAVDPGLALAAKQSCSYGACKTLNLRATASHASSSGFSGSIIRTIIGLAIVLAVIYGLYWVMKQARAAKSPATGYGLEQLASLPLGTNRSLALVRVGAEIHLIGVSEHGITGIRVYSEEEAYELGLPLDGPEDGASAWNGGAPPVERLVETLRRFTVR